MLQGGATGSKTIDLKHSASHRNLQVKLLSVYTAWLRMAICKSGDMSHATCFEVQITAAQVNDAHEDDALLYTDTSQRSASGMGASVSTAAWVKPAAYGLLNISAATGIVFANKAVLSVYGFEFTTALTLLHTLTTVLGMTLFCQLGFFSPKVVPTLQVRPLLCCMFCH